MSNVGPEGRSYEKITTADLQRLARIAIEDREAFFEKDSSWGELYRDRVLAIALCQGAAGHYVYGEGGVNDFDVYTFYEDNPARHWYAKRNPSADFGDPKFGQTVDKPNYVGRRVDLLGRGIKYRRPEDPAAAICRWLRTDKGTSAPLLAQKPVVLLAPEERVGEIIWNPDAVRSTV
jgi:hypothetical protein